MLKVLKRSKDPGRRARMVREVDALRRFDHPGVPKLIDDNCECTTPSVELFFVMEHVSGPTLGAAIEDGGVKSLDDALQFMEALIDVVASCHERGLVHRDIKPDNIVLRNGDLSKPTLLDFGLSVHVDDHLHVTETEQQIGNRFLGLPELRTPGDDKRDVRGDLTLCSGILFYLLTGRQPTTLADGAGRKPHQRSDVQGMCNVSRN